MFQIDPGMTRWKSVHFKGGLQMYNNAYDNDNAYGTLFSSLYWTHSKKQLAN